MRSWHSISQLGSHKAPGWSFLINLLVARDNHRVSVKPAEIRGRAFLIRAGVKVGGLALAAGAEMSVNGTTAVGGRAVVLAGLEGLAWIKSPTTNVAGRIGAQTSVVVGAKFQPQVRRRIGFGGAFPAGFHLCSPPVSSRIESGEK